MQTNRMKHTIKTSLLNVALQQALERIAYTIPHMGTDRPALGKADYTYTRCNDRDWVDGFWSGQLWLAYSYTQDKTFYEAACQQRSYFFERLERPQTHTHDLGFLYQLSLVADYKLTGNLHSQSAALQAANNLAARYQPTYRALRAWNRWGKYDDPGSHDNQGRIIIDTMENLALLHWASQQTGIQHFKDIAIEHARTSLQYLVRPDNTTYHTFHFNPQTGDPVGPQTHQGYADDSCWSRGQAWAIHGFAMAYQHTGIEEFLTTSRRLADYALAHLPEDKVPYWDYCLPEDAPHYRDSSAGAITAAGLFLLADHLGDATAAAHYHSAGLQMLGGLIEGYTTVDIPHAEGLLKHGAGNVPTGLSDTMLSFGDYYYLEALLRAINHQTFFW